MAKRSVFKVRLRRDRTGEEHDRLIFASNEATAKERATVRARSALGSTMAERKYGKFEVVSCALAPRHPQ